jgi:predicted transcriptional regulator
MFDGVTYNDAEDGQRLYRQLLRVLDVLADGEPHGLAEIAERTGDPPASVSARIRDLRKLKFGGYTVISKNHGHGFWTYQLVI